MTDKSLLFKLRTVARVVWRFIASIWREPGIADAWSELSKIFWNVWEEKDKAYNALAQNDDKKNLIPLKQGVLSLPGRNSKTGDLECILSMSSILGIIAGMILGAFVLYWGGFIWGGLILIAVFIFLFLMLPVLNYQANNYYLGYLGERIVAEELDNLVSQHGFLPHQWHFFHSFFPEEESKGDIDHIIVCPKGVFCVETKTWRKRNGEENIVNFEDGVLTINNSQHNEIIGQVQNNAWRMHHFLKKECGETGFVKSIIIFPGWKTLHDEVTPNSTVFVFNLKLFHLLFPNKPDKLNQKQIDSICAAIKKHNRTSLEQIEEILS